MPWPACAVAPPRPAANPSTGSRPSSIRGSPRPGRRPIALWDAARRSREEGYLAEARTAGRAPGRDGPGRRRLRTGGPGGHARPLRRRRGGADPQHAPTPSQHRTPATGPRSPAVPAIPGLPADAVVEVPCRVTPDGVVPVPQDRPAPAQLELMRRVKDVERLVVEAATTGRREAALAAFARHPLVDSEVLAGKLLAGYEAAFPELGRSGTGRPVRNAGRRRRPAAAGQYPTACGTSRAGPRSPVPGALNASGMVASTSKPMDFQAATARTLLSTTALNCMARKPASRAASSE